MTPLRHLAAALLGAAVALAAVAVHRQGVGGLLLAWAASALAAWRLGRSSPRGLALTYAGGWVVLLALVLTGRPEGDYAVASDLRGYALMAAGPAVLAVGVASLRRIRA